MFQRNKSVGTKAPKMRFKIGQRVLYEGVEYKIFGAFRMADDPHEWKYQMVDWTPIVQTMGMYALDEIANATEGIDVERIVYEPFRYYTDVSKHFFSIPAPPGRRGDTCIASNKQLIQSAKVIP